VTPSQAVPRGTAPGARARLLSAEPDGVKHYVIVLQDGDEVATALAEFAHKEHVVNAHLEAIGAVHDAEVGWFDRSRGAYKVSARREPMEVLTLSGDIALGEDGEPVVHAHIVLGGSAGTAWGGHLLSALVSQTLEVYLTTFPTPLHKRRAAIGLQLMDPSIGSEE
jgi:predicted DNA-binding protein with PD1-like motif